MLSTTQPSTGILGVRGHFLVPGSLQGESAWCFSAQQKNSTIYFTACESACG